MPVHVHFTDSTSGGCFNHINHSDSSNPHPHHSNNNSNSNNTISNSEVFSAATLFSFFTLFCKDDRLRQCLLLSASTTASSSSSSTTTTATAVADSQADFIDSDGAAVEDVASMGAEAGDGGSSGASAGTPLAAAEAFLRGQQPASSLAAHLLPARPGDGGAPREKAAYEWEEEEEENEEENDNEGLAGLQAVAPYLFFSTPFFKVEQSLCRSVAALNSSSAAAAPYFDFIIAADARSYENILDYYEARRLSPCRGGSGEAGPAGQVVLLYVSESEKQPPQYHYSTCTVAYHFLSHLISSKNHGNVSSGGEGGDGDKEWIDEIDGAVASIAKLLGVEVMVTVI